MRRTLALGAGGPAHVHALAYVGSSHLAAAGDSGRIALLHSTTDRTTNDPSTFGGVISCEANVMSGTHAGDVGALRSSATTLATGGADGRVALWDITSLKCVTHVRPTTNTKSNGGGGTSHVNDVCFVGRGASTSSNSSGYTVVASAHRSGNIVISDLRANPSSSSSSSSVQTIALPDSVQALEMVPRDVLVATCLDGALRRLDLRTGRILEDHIVISNSSNSSNSYPNRNPPLTSLSMSADSAYALVGSTDSRLRLLHVSQDNTTSVVRTFTGHKSVSSSVHSVLAFQDQVILSGSEPTKVNPEPHIHVWGVEAPREEHLAIPVHPPLVQDIGTGTSGSRWATTSTCCANEVLYSSNGEREVAVGSPYGGFVHIMSL